MFDLETDVYLNDASVNRTKTEVEQTCNCDCEIQIKLVPQIQTKAFA